MIRLTGGSLGGRTLPLPVAEGVRPTAARVREAVYSMLGQDLTGRSFLDLCGGSGLMALEAASRGAAPVTLVERDREAILAIRGNVARLGARVDVLLGDAHRIPLRPHDVVYVDPPYKDGLDPWLTRAAPLAVQLLVMEARRRSEWPGVRGFHLDRVRHYGETSVAIWARGSGEGGGTLARGAEPEVVGDDRGVVEDDGGG